LILLFLNKGGKKESGNLQSPDSLQFIFCNDQSVTKILMLLCHMLPL
jgi:hypothetical protein